MQEWEKKVVKGVGQRKLLCSFNGQNAFIIEKKYKLQGEKITKSSKSSGQKSLYNLEIKFVDDIIFRPPDRHFRIYCVLEN